MSGVESSLLLIMTIYGGVSLHLCSFLFGHFFLVLVVTHFVYSEHMFIKKHFCFGGRQPC